MRISDWSSDVCSSDLVVAVPQDRHLAGRGREFVAFAPLFPRLVIERHDHFLEGKAGQLARQPAAQRPADRKSVVEGKSVSVRVDLGGRRIIKKKKKKDIHMRETKR